MKKFYQKIIIFIKHLSFDINTFSNQIWLKNFNYGFTRLWKNYLSEHLYKELNAVSINADKVRREANDWDFSLEGRKRQAKRMRDLAKDHISKGYNIVADFICPTETTRKEFNADIIIWVDTIKAGRFDDTNDLFEPPKNYDFIITKKDDKLFLKKI